MGIEDREYYKQTGPYRGVSFGTLGLWSITTWLIVINVVVFVANGLLGRLMPIDPPMWGNEPLSESDFHQIAIRENLGPFAAIGAFTVDAAVYHLQIWRFVTYQFLHAGPGHIFFNMLGLFFFGRYAESALGRRRYLAFYLLCGVGGAVVEVFLAQLGLFDLSPFTPTIGASACVFGILIAVAILYPDTTVYLLLPPLPVNIRILVFIYMGLALYTVLVNGPNAGGEGAHLGGALAGFLLIRNMNWLNWADSMSFNFALPQRSAMRSTSRQEVIPIRSSPAQRRQSDREKQRLREEIDRILDKINSQGMGSLTDEERKTLLRGKELKN